MASYRKGDQVEWDWGDGTAQGTIVEVHKEKVTKTLKGTDVTRAASEDEPAYLIKQEDGDKVLKSCTEIRAA
ncbi:DUF2945 domain-containing protein [Pseudaestuariivita rosea]|uniref:DUF2945 domain-containing protein n=1 Tax=Pseudaestuariivita rosea TaxID=2763263 RepID=UPI001ABB7078|nr:DUF2945 domain-containing protein [Pseudaestuariivita rosea]